MSRFLLINTNTGIQRVETDLKNYKRLAKIPLAQIEDTTFHGIEGRMVGQFHATTPEDYLALNVVEHLLERQPSNETEES